MLAADIVHALVVALRTWSARGNRGHMGNPGAEDILYDWLDKAVA